ncbi:TonB-dependent receptor [Paludibaculum fermentans]|uniref:TonB-dependent receptor n=1 Tax=Paludibaculum fermentans TaxID=1473598 RepID=A0A7S7NVW4_PALFE|nr:TonB-dependent receptor [Paludibaculum fermentans]QOY90149.1 TonB-dependent receptor [Paludibaculum fermentans]
MQHLPKLLLKRTQLFLLVTLLSVLATAQVITSSLNGFVTDASGAAVPGAQVTIRETQTGFTRTQETNTQGQYTFTGIPAGIYDISVERSGFQVSTRSAQQLTQQLDLRADFQLQIGNSQQSIAVAATTPLLQTENASLAVTVASKQLVELPALGRSYISTLILSPGVSPILGGNIGSVVFGQSQTGGAVFKPISANISGGPPEFTGFVEDGFDVRDPIYGGALYQPSVEALQSYRIVRGYDSAQFGGSPSVVYTSSKAGTNELHGSLFWFLQNKVTNARTNGALAVPPLVYNQAGATLGGPVVIPGLYNGKNRTFFFFSAQVTRQRSGSNQQAIVPTEAQWAGDFSQYPQTIYNPFDVDTTNNTRRAFAGNRIPASLLSPFAQGYKKYVPLPNLGAVAFGQPNLSVFGSQRNDDTQYLTRVDQSLGTSGRLFFKYFWDNVGAYSYGLSTFAGFAQPLKGQTASVEYTQPIGGRIVNQLRVGFFRSETNYGAVPTTQDIAGSELGLKNISRNSAFFGLPNVGVTGVSVPGTAIFNLNRATTRLGVNENISFFTGRHTIDLGFTIQPSQYPQNNGIYPRGSLSYDGGFTRQAPGGAGGAGIADFVLGAFASAAGNPTGFAPILNTTYYGWFAQDQIKMSRRLTMTFGLRWDYWTPPVERYNRMVAFDQNQGKLVFVLKNPLNFQQDYSTLSGDLPRGVFKNWKKTNFSPRVSLAYLLTPKTTIRAAYGIYYTQGMANFQLFSSLGFGGPPFTNNTNVVNDPSLLTPTRLDTQIFPAPPIGEITPGTLFVTQDSYAPQSFVHQATFSVEHQLGERWLLSAGYNAFLGRHLMAPYNVNQAALYDPANPKSLEARRPYPFFSDILLQGNSANSSYNGAYLHVRRTMSKGLDLTASYTYSKSLDLFSSNSGGWDNQDARNTQLDRGRSDYDQTHAFTTGIVYELPFGKGKSFAQGGVGAAVLGDWQLSTIIQHRSGLPLSLSMPTSWPNVAATFTKARPNRICDGRLSDGTMDRYFDTNCFVAPPANQFGNAGRNVLTAPPTQSYDVSLARSFHLERVRLDFRAESYSVFNIQNWNTPNTSLVSPNYGKIFGKNNPRRFQFGLRAEF